MTQVSAVLRLNMSGSSVDREAEAGRYAAALEMAQLADRGGFAVVNVEEHHDASIGWLPSPLIMAALITSRTQRIQVRASALLAPLYDPIRLAEDVAILDLASRGRFVFVLGQGYRPIEYHMMDRAWDARGATTDHVIETLLQAWKGEPFDYRGRRVQVSPRPYSQPHPPFYYGGMSVPAVRRAARYGLPYFPPQPSPQLEALYLAELARFGTSGRLEVHRDMSLLFVDEDPQAAWEELGPYFLRETREYAAWARPGVDRHYESESVSIAQLRSQCIFEILTPEECLARARASKHEYKPVLHPLAGGIAAERALRCVDLYATQVLALL